MAKQGTPTIEKYFKLFPYFHDDVKLSIVSFCAHAPLETFPYSSSTLVSYRQISRNFQKLCDSDVLWKDALRRMCRLEPMFESALRKITNENHHGLDDLLELATQQHQNNGTTADTTTYKKVYQSIVNDVLRFTGPVFVMPGIVALGQTYTLHLFEGRYRLMIQRLVERQPDEARQGGPITDDIYFIHANRAPLQVPLPAVLVRLEQCRIYEDGRADVVLLPLYHVCLEKLWVLENSGHLYMAQSLRMGRQLSRQLNRLQRQETLAHVMDDLAAQLASMESSPNGGSDSYGSSSEVWSSGNEQHHPVES